MNDPLSAAQHEYIPNRAPMNTPQAACVQCGKPIDDPAHPSQVSEEIKQRMVEELKKQAQPQLPEQPHQWSGDTPVFLVFERGPADNVGIDVDTPGWIETNQELFRTPGTWLLMLKPERHPMKQTQALVAVVMMPDEQFYFVKHHVGDLMAGREVVTYGMGKKQADGNTVNLWLMPNGMVVGGTEGEADLLASRMLRPAKAAPKP